MRGLIFALPYTDSGAPLNLKLRNAVNTVLFVGFVEVAVCFSADCRKVPSLLVIAPVKINNTLWLIKILNKWKFL